METYSADVGQGGGWGPDDQGSLRLSVTFMEMIYLCSRTHTSEETGREGGRERLRERERKRKR